MYIEDGLYNDIVKSVPILCVDGIIIKDNKILLFKRVNEPLKDIWWVPGGRVNKGEILTDAIIRKVKDEAGVESIILKMIDVVETIFENKHTVNVCYLVDILSDNIILNDEHSEYKWFDIYNLPTYIDSVIVNLIKKTV